MNGHSPARGREQTRAGKQEDRSKDRSAGYLLVVDDNELNRDMLSRRLSRKGYQVETAADGQEALEMIGARDYELVLLDIMMPGISGLEVLRQLRETRSRADLPVIMATAKSESADIVEALRLGANDYVTKPLDFPVVLARVGAQIGLAQANKEIRRLAEELEVRNRFIRDVFGRYLSEDIVTTLLETPEGLALGGEKREISILMCDIRGFSLLAARLEPTEVVELVNNFLSVMTEVILEYGGTIDEFIGDAILVLFGAPLARDDHAEAAVACALAMQLATGKVNELNLAAGLPAVEMGAGINTGEVVVGNIGSDRRAKYGVVGTNVNLAARIEGYTVGGQVLVSERTRNAVGSALRVRRTIRVRPKGADSELTLSDVCGLGGGHDLQLPEHDDAFWTPSTPLSARVVVLEGKDASGPARNATVLRLSDAGLELVAEGAFLEPLSNVSLEIMRDGGADRSGEIHAKVLAVSDNAVRLQFTSLADQDGHFIRALAP